MPDRSLWKRAVPGSSAVPGCGPDGLTRLHEGAVVSGSPARERFSLLCSRDARTVEAESVNRSADRMITRRPPAEGGCGPASDGAAPPGFGIRRQRARPV
ncbi:MULTISPECIES: oxidoreductase C-terminal domain-containing protein [Streptomyces]|uniref:Oxidoreductase C-terminal domain-containing protein n=1 Tax=Streptomyces tendae TaxID=1932 RepID=A0A6B3QUL4_STRTE|nr:hypothetical protein [Streptomyces sp. RK74B]MBQ1009042.1 hypothetical protein [Streptomyces sp. RK23]MZG15409.1 hypothetical protein [Streptomyces sp. SID5914]NEV89941.1 hypothetical protein [Streptomyces tendae]